MATSNFSPRLTWAGYLIGFGLGGFFDGILLHQILQWHHLLSLVDGVGDLRNQVLFDGLFHALMYIIAGAGLVMLMRSRAAFGEHRANRRFLGSVLLGFGVWHVADSVLSHWILGIHRIKIDSPNPLFWDLLWFALFALGPLFAGWRLRRGGGDNGRTGRSAPIIAGISALVLASGIWAARPPNDTSSAIAIFRPGMNDGAIFNAIKASDGQLVWQSRGIWAVRWEKPGHSSRLYREGALLVSNGFIGAGCLAWAQG
jgi:uncharacterized membrane protein